MTKLPTGWAATQIPAIADVLDSRRVPLNAQERATRKGPFPYYGANGLVDHVDGFLFEGEHVLLAEDGGHFHERERGVAYQVNGKFWVNNHAHVLKPADSIPCGFLRAWLNAIDWGPYVGGTTRAKLTQAGLGLPTVPLPPLAEQRRIVTKLDALSARTARARADLDRVPALADGYRLALLRSALRGQVTEGWRAQHAAVETAKDLVARSAVPLQGRGGREATTEVIDGQAALAVNDPGRDLPSGWAWIPLLRVARQETGHTPSRSVSNYWGGGVPWIGIRDAGAHHGSVISETLQTISEAGLANSSARLLPAQTVCLSRTASVGYVTIMGHSMATSQDFATWTCNEALNPKYLMYALMAEGDDIRAFGKGTTHTTIYFPEIRALHIALAPIDEQGEIVRVIETGLAEIDRLVAEAAAARRLLDRLDQAILAKAFRGELVGQDPADEPASVLLDRIRAGRAVGPARTGRGRRARAA